MMVIGGVLFLVGVAGCFGAATGKSGLLNIYFVVVLVVLVLEIIVVVLGKLYTFAENKVFRHLLLMFG